MPTTKNKIYNPAIKRNVLIVDDEQINREMLGMLLDGEGYDLLYAEDGQQALDLLLTERISLVLLDVLMPVLSGTELLLRMHNDPALRRVPVIVLTSDSKLEVDCLKLGASDFIPKPYPPADIIRARVRRTIELSEDRELIGSTERDPLTGLFNREFFYRYSEQLDRALDCPMDAVLVNIHRFHIINERSGKAWADRLLITLAELLRNMVHKDGGIVCRREADSFLAYMPHKDDYTERLERLREDLTEISGDSHIRLRAGVYPNVDKSLHIERRFDRAQSAADLLRGSFNKTVGYYDDEMHLKELYAEQLIEAFPTALRERQFSVFYQPKYDIRGIVPKLASAEALVRWRHPTLGMISPGVFIPLFEENGLILELDRYVWREAAAQIQRWKQKFGYAVPVSVNVSRVDMYDPRLLDTFRGVLEDNKLLPHELMLEITESAYTQDSHQIIDTVTLLRKLGFRIEMDDFGTGYSSLNMISSLPIDVLKLDMQFIRDAFREGRDTRLIEIIIEIAEYLGVPVVAEGVETREQLLALKSMGCHLIQGYYFSKPLPAEEFEPFILKHLEAMREAQEEDLHRQETGRGNLQSGHVMQEQLAATMEWLAERIPGGFFIYRNDATQRILYANRELLRIFGCKNMAEFNALTGGTFAGVVHPDDYAAIQNSIVKQIGSEVLEMMDYVEYRIVRRDGLVRWVNDYGHLTELTGVGKVFCVFISDITERKEKQI